MPGYLRFRFFGPPPSTIKPPPATVVDLDDLLSALVAALKADPTLAAILGPRIYPEHPPASAGTAASLCYEVISERRTYTLSGATALPEVRVRLIVRSLNFADVSAVRKRLRDWFDGFRGKIGNVRVLFARFHTVIDKYKDPLPGSDRGTYLRQIDLKFRLAETAPSNN